MERKAHNISAAQFFIGMFVSRVVVTLAINARYTGGENPIESIFSYAIAMAAGILIALPIWRLHKDHPGENINRVAINRLGKWGKVIPMFYIGYFIAANGASLALFQIFLMDTVNPDFSAGLVILALLGVAWYGAWRGIEAVARCATCVFAVLILGCLLVFAIVAGRFKTENLSPLFYNGWEQTARGVALFLARTSIFADMAVLLPHVQGNTKKSFAGWLIGTTAFVGVLLLLLAGCLGPYAYTQNFPVYALASITQVRSLQRLDAVFIGVWMMGLIIKLAFDLYACRVCFSELCTEKRTTLAVTGAAAGVLIIALCAGAGVCRGIVLSLGLLLCCTLFTGLILPLFVLAVDKIKGKKEGKG